MKKVGAVLGVVVLLGAGLVLIKVALGLLVPLVDQGADPLVLTVAYAGIQLAVLAPMLLLVLLAARLSRTPLSDAGLFVDRRALRHFLWGGAVTATAGALTSLTFIALHRPRYALRMTSPARAVALVLLDGIATVFQAGYEELWMRSLPLALLAWATTRHAAVAAIALCFAAVHLLNPQYEWLAVVNTALAGWLMGYAFFGPVRQPPSVWRPWGMHWGWNLITGGVFFNRQLFAVTLDGEPVTQFNGAEATVAGCLLLALALVAILWLQRRDLAPSDPT